MKLHKVIILDGQILDETIPLSRVIGVTIEGTFRENIYKVYLDREERAIYHQHPLGKIYPTGDFYVVLGERACCSERLKDEYKFCPICGKEVL